MDTYIKIGYPAPPFAVCSTCGNISFPADYNGKWIVLYAYVGDFLPCAASDILALNAIAPRLASYNAEVTAISPDTVACHIAWVLSLRNLNGGRDIGISLMSNRDLAVFKLYGVQNATDDSSKNEKAVFIIDDGGILRAAHFLPQGTGVNTTELERELLALQTACCQHGITPSGWTPGEDIMDFPPQTVATAGCNVSEKTANGGRCVDWYICYRQDSGKRRPSKTEPAE